jgi:hypothetical protein
MATAPPAAWAAWVEWICNRRESVPCSGGSARGSRHQKAPRERGFLRLGRLDWLADGPSFPQRQRPFNGGLDLRRIERLADESVGAGLNGRFDVIG